MTEDATKADLPKKPKPPIVDLDAGGSWEPFEVTLLRPFRLMGNVYDTAIIRVPTGADLELHMRGALPPMEEIRNLAVALTGWPDVVFARMAAGDRQRILGHVGEFIAGVR